MLNSCIERMLKSYTIYTCFNRYYPAGVATCEQFLSVPHCFSTLTDLFGVAAEKLEHSGLKVLRFIERKRVEPAPTKHLLPVELASFVKRVAPVSCSVVPVSWTCKPLQNLHAECLTYVLITQQLSNKT